MKHTLQKPRRITRTRKHVQGTTERPRLSVFRSNSAIYAQIIDDTQKKTLLGVSLKQLEAKQGKKIDMAKALGEHMAKKAKEQKIAAVVFDRGGYKYHGRVKAFAEGAREGGLQF